MQNLSLIDNKKKNILLIDDDSTLLIYLKNIISKKIDNINIKTINNPKTALQYINSSSFDLIILDVNMPTIDGYQLCQIIKESKKTNNTSIIFVTANNDTLSINKAFQCGAIDYITKPFINDELIARVAVHLKTRLYHDFIIQQNRQLQISEKKYRNILQNNPLGIIETDLNGNILYRNSKFSEIITEKNINNLNDFYYKEDNPTINIITFIQQQFKENKKNVVELILKNKNKQIENIIKTHWTKVPKTKKYIVTLQDITKQRQLEDQMQKTNYIVNESDTVLIELNTNDLSIKYITPNIKKLIGYSAEEIIANNNLIYGSSKNKEKILKNIQKNIKLKTNVLIEELEINNANNIKKYLGIKINIFYNIALNPQNIFILLTDITTMIEARNLRKEIQKKQEEQMKKQIQQLDQELLAYISHNININSIHKQIITNLKKIAITSSKTNKQIINNIIKDLSHNENDLLNNFKTRFQSIHHDFEKKLLDQFPELTQNDIKLAMFLRLNMSIKDIAKIFYQSPDSIKVAISRLRKKLQLQSNQKLYNFFVNY